MDSRGSVLAVPTDMDDHSLSCESLISFVALDDVASSYNLGRGTIIDCWVGVCHRRETS